MSTVATLSSIPSTIPAPSRQTDVFDFLHTPAREKISDDCITVQESENTDLVAVIIEKPDGRCVRRNVPTASWQDRGYRGALIRNMSLVAA